MGNLQAAFIALPSICFILNIPPLTWHIINKNIPAMTLLIYIEIMMIDGFVSAIIWGGENYVSTWDGAGWCDLMVRFQYAIAVGISSCISCVSFNLLMIFVTNKLTIFWFSNKWFKPICDISISIIFPFFISGITYFAQKERYIISRFTGCSAPLANESISILVFYLWIFFWSFIGMIISFTTLILFFKKRKAAKDILVCTNSGLSIKRFIRLLIFCLLVISTSIIFSAIIGSKLVIEKGVFFQKDILTTKSWHFIFRLTHVSSLDINKWVLISISFISFFIFGVGEDAKLMYILILKKIPYGNLILNKLKLIKLEINKKLGINDINEENRFKLRFWNYDEDEENDKSSLNNESYNDSLKFKYYNSKKANDHYDEDEDDDDVNLSRMREYDDISIDKLDYLSTEKVEDLGSLATPATAKTTDTLMKYYNDKNLEYQLNEAKREVEEEEGRQQLQGSSVLDDIDELKYLYY